jgi:hypothetical protein
VGSALQEVTEEARNCWQMVESSAEVHEQEARDAPSLDRSHQSPACQSNLYVKRLILFGKLEVVLDAPVRTGTCEIAESTSDDRRQEDKVIEFVVGCSSVEAHPNTEARKGCQRRHTEPHKAEARKVVGMAMQVMVEAGQPNPNLEPQTLAEVNSMEPGILAQPCVLCR